jgi:hypothetical protein
MIHRSLSNYPSLSKRCQKSTKQNEALLNRGRAEPLANLRIVAAFLSFDKQSADLLLAGIHTHTELRDWWRHLVLVQCDELWWHMLVGV